MGKPGGGNRGNLPGRYPLPGPLAKSKNPSKQSLVREKLNMYAPPPGPGRSRLKTTDFRRKIHVRTLPRDPGGRGGGSQTLNICLDLVKTCFKLANRASGPESVHFGGLHGPLLPQNPMEKVRGEAPCLFQWVLLQGAV